MFHPFFIKAISFAKANDIQSFVKLFEDNPSMVNIKQGGNEGETLIKKFFYVLSDDILIPFLEVLIQHKVIIKQSSELENSPLESAAFLGKLNTVIYLTENIDFSPEEIDRAFLAACKRLAQGLTQTPIKIVLLSIIKYLIKEKNANIDAIDDMGKSAIHIAKEFDSKELDFLIMKEADLNIKYQKNINEVPSLVIKAINFAKSNDIESFKKLFEDNPSMFNIQERGSEGETLIKKIIYFIPDSSIVAFLTVLNNHKAIVNLSSAIKDSSIDCAASLGMLNAVVYLTENIHFSSKQIDHAFLTACKRLAQGLCHTSNKTAFFSVIKYLVEVRKANINAVDDMGKTALMYAAEESNPKELEYLISKDADLTIKHPKNNGKQLWSVLSYAFSKYMSIENTYYSINLKSQNKNVKKSLRKEYIIADKVLVCLLTSIKKNIYKQGMEQSGFPPLSIIDPYVGRFQVFPFEVNSFNLKSLIKQESYDLACEELRKYWACSKAHFISYNPSKKSLRINCKDKNPKPTIKLSIP